MAGAVDFSAEPIEPGAEALGAARQGTRFNKALSWSAGGVALPLTNVGIRMQIRRTPTNPTVILSLARGGYIVVTNEAGGLFEIDIPATVMATLPTSTPEGFWYDLELIPNNDDTKAFALLAGRFVILAEVTR